MGGRVSGVVSKGGGAFQRPSRLHNRKDARGKIRVQVILLDEARKAHTTGNITRSFTLYEARVSEVAAWLEEKLFNGKKV